MESKRILIMLNFIGYPSQINFQQVYTIHINVPKPYHGFTNSIPFDYQKFDIYSEF